MMHAFKRILFVLFLAFVTGPALAQHQAHEAHEMSDEDAVKAVIVSGYVEGMHINSDAAAARAAFHPEFIMHFARDGEVRQVTLDQWVSRLDGKKNENNITYEFEWVDVTGSTAKAKLKVFENGTHIFTDYMGLYKLAGDWRIVNKIFESHP